MQPDYQSWVEPLPDFKYNVRLLVKEYQKYVADAGLMIRQSVRSNPATSDDDYKNPPWLISFHVFLNAERPDFGVLNNMPYTRTVIDQLSRTYDSNCASLASFRCLMPNSCLSWHQDAGNLCYHIPLITNPGCWFVYEGKSFHMPADGLVYTVNDKPMHTFVNSGDKPRIHFTLKKLDTPEVNIGDVRIGDPGVDI